MRRYAFVIACLAALPLATGLSAGTISDIEVNVRLDAAGNARIVERWYVEDMPGTEMYINRVNLGDMTVSDLTVTDYDIAFRNIGEWDVNRTYSEKSWKCGIVHKYDGVELCWGISGEGRHEYVVSYLMTRTVRGMDDYDCFHIQLVSPGIEPRPEHVSVSISSDVASFDSSNTRLWGFGFEGQSGFSDGAVRFESTAGFRSGSSVIALLRFEKGIFSPESIDARPFSDVLDRAMEGADFGDGEEGFNAFEILLFLLVPFMIILSPILARNRIRKKILGVRKKEVPWYRDIPYDGNLDCTNYILNKLGEIRKENSLASALILRMIYKGYLNVSTDKRGRIEISFNDSKDRSELGNSANDLYLMMKEASGSDMILQDKEFSRWSSKHQERIRTWVSTSELDALEHLRESGCKSGKDYTDTGRIKAQEALGFKKFLSDFTLSGEKSTIEVNLWQEYLVFASLFGIADKVAKELQDINPKVFEEVLVYDYPTMRSLVYTTNNLARAITDAKYQSSQGTSASGGFGGMTSFGGGGGFHGGGFGGGAR